jgi:hypothetical protein
MGFHVVWCVASSDNVLIVALGTKYLTFDLSKSADWVFKRVFVSTRQAFI